ncbi:MAG: guanylate kinase [Coriobacteriales bacterium]|jgi:guanylate kinase|nr:guanylate kinase [Coriobacteriales bacterium]
MSTKGHLFVISGPSGVGKGTLVEKLLQRQKGIALSVSATTRPPRAGDRDGVTYHFLSDAQFDMLIAADGFLEWAEVHGWRYGTLVSEVERILASGQDLILEIDIQGNDLIKKRLPDAVSIFIAPPSLSELKQRLLQRGTEDEAAVARRLETAKLELQAQNRYNVIIENDDLDAACAALAQTVEAYRQGM